MTHDEAKAQISALFEQRPHEVQHAALLEHLKSCESCRALYDRHAQTVRRLRGRPDEMTAEELSLFSPPLPPAKVVPLFRTGPLVAMVLAAGLAAVVFWVRGQPKDDFTARGQAVPAAKASLRVLCSHEGQLGPLDRCAAGDTLYFAVTPRGNTQVALVVDGSLLGATAVAPDGVDTPLSWTATFKPGVKAQAVFSRSAPSAHDVLACARDTICPEGLEVSSAP